MCTPIAIGIAGLATSLGSTGFSFMQAIGADAANKEQFLAAAELTNQQVVQEYENLHLRGVAEEGASNQTMQDITRDAEEAKAVAVARAADVGVSGNSVAALIQEFERDQGTALAMERRNRKLRAAQMAAEKTSLHTRTRASLLGAAPAPSARPDFIGNIGSGVGQLLKGVGASQRAAASSNLTAPLNEGGS